jgi:hypothetical protein
VTESAPTYCYKHPTRETGLRCNTCDRYICASCAVHTPTGYKCPECIRERNKNFFAAYTTTNWYDYLIGPAVAGFLGFLGTMISSYIGFFIYFLIILGPLAGVYIARAVQWAVKRRRSKHLPIAATAAVVIGGLLSQWSTLFYLFLTRDISILVTILWPGIFIFLAAATTYMRLAGIQLNR